MTSPDPIRQLALNNATVSKNFTPKYRLPDLRTNPISVIISCVDPRADPKDFWAIAPHGFPGVVRNAGGRAVDALRTLEVLSALGTGLESVAVVHHTDCGVGPHGVDNEEVREKLKERGKGVKEVVGGLEGKTWETWKGQSAEESVKEDMKLLREHPLFPDGLLVLGYVLDDETGVTTEVFLE